MRRTPTGILVAFPAVLALAAPSPAFALDGQAIGQATGEAVTSALARDITIGPMLGGAMGVGTDPLTAEITAGLALSVMDRGRAGPGPVLGATLAGGYRFRESCGLVGLGVSFGWWRLSAGLSLLGAIGQEHSGFGLGPELTFHLRLPASRTGHELQLFGRADYMVAGDVPDQLTFGLRLVYDLFR